MGKAAKSLIVVAIATLIALSFTWFAGVNSVTVFGVSAMFACGVLALAINWLVFIPSAIVQADTYYDTVGAATYLSVLALACYSAHTALGGLDLRAIVIAAMVAVWCIRLGSFLFRRIHAMGGADSRFVKIKVNPARFLVAWTLQALWVILTASAAVAVITSANPQPIGVFFYAGAAIWVIGMAFEVIADGQKRDFKADPANAGKFINTGLWWWSRHPNYFGEMVMWFGIWITCSSTMRGLEFLTVLSPCFVAFLIAKVSGIPILERMAEKRWGEEVAYRAYRDSTPLLVPFLW